MPYSLYIFHFSGKCAYALCFVHWSWFCYSWSLPNQGKYRRDVSVRKDAVYSRSFLECLQKWKSPNCHAIKNSVGDM